MIKYSDYTPPKDPMVVIDGALVEYNGESLSCLAQNGMLLALGAQRAQAMVKPHDKAISFGPASLASHSH